MLTDFCSFCEDIYGGSHYIETTPMGFKVLVIENSTDKFKINLSDKMRFDKFNLSHRSNSRLLDGGYAYHVQARVRELSYAIFMAYAHFFHKSRHILWTQEDYQRFMQDWKRSLA